MDFVPRRRPAPICFQRRELNKILSMYGRLVASGECKDYALDTLSDCAIFSIYRRACEAPLFQIEKFPANARRQGAFSLRGADGRILRRGHELGPILRAIEPKRMRIVED